MWKTRLARGLIGLLLVLVIGRAVAMFSSPKADPGVTNGKLAKSPKSPNCVNSQSDRQDTSYIPPLQVSTPGTNPIRMLAELVEQLPRTKLITLEDDYAYFQFRSRLFGFVDDVEFMKDRQRNVIHVRSASRLGYSDMGTNRKRIERIRELWTKK